MKFLGLIILITSLLFGVTLVIGSDYDTGEYSSNLDPISNAEECVFDPNNLQKCEGLKQLKQSPLLSKFDCLQPYRHSTLHNACIVDKNTDFFIHGISCNKCFFGDLDTDAKTCKKFDERKTCYWKKKNLDFYKNLECSDNPYKEVCVIDKKPDVHHHVRVNDVENYFFLGSFQVFAPISYEVYFHKNKIEIENFEHDWRLLITKFKLCVYAFVKNKNFRPEHQYQIEKWCMLMAIEEYYVHKLNFAETINVLRYRQNEISNIILTMTQVPRIAKDQKLTLFFEGNEDRFLPNEARFRILLYDKRDEKSLNHDLCFD